MYNLFVVRQTSLKATCRNQILLRYAVQLWRFIMAKTPAWQRKEGKAKSGGLNAKGRASAKAQGMNLKPPVSAKQAKKSPKSAARR